MAIFYVDGEFVEDSMAAIPLTDMAVLRGYAVFDFLRTYNGRPFFLDEHIERLQNSASLLFIQCPWSRAIIKDVVHETLRKNGFKESNIRLLITGGDSSDSITPLEKPRLIIMVTPVTAHPKTWYSDGVKIITSDVTRYIPGAKSTNYIKAIVALKRASLGGAIESIYVNEDNQLLEGTTSNIFFVFDDQVVTPKEGILPGITRKAVVELAGEKLELSKRSITRTEMMRCDEAFLTSSTKEIVPVVQIDEISISVKPGPVTRQVMEFFQQYTESW